MTLDVTNLITTLTGSGIVAALILQFAKQLWADASARFGSLFTQIGLLVICIIIAILAYFFNFLPTNIVVFITGTFATAITIYETVYRAVIQQAIMGKSTN